MIHGNVLRSGRYGSPSRRLEGYHGTGARNGIDIINSELQNLERSRQAVIPPVLNFTAPVYSAPHVILPTPPTPSSATGGYEAFSDTALDHLSNQELMWAHVQVKRALARRMATAGHDLWTDDQPPMTPPGTDSSSGPQRLQDDVAEVVLVGDSKTGKTPIFNCLKGASRGEVGALIRSSGGPTIFETAIVDFGDCTKVELWDMGGAQSDEKLRAMSYPGVDVVVYCYASADRATFDNVHGWVEEVRRCTVDVDGMYARWSGDSSHVCETMKELMGSHRRSGKSMPWAVLVQAKNDLAQEPRGGHSGFCEDILRVAADIHASAFTATSARYFANAQPRHGIDELHCVLSDLLKKKSNGEQAPAWTGVAYGLQ